MNVHSSFFSFFFSVPIYLFCSLFYPLIQENIVKNNYKFKSNYRKYEIKHIYLGSIIFSEEL